MRVACARGAEEVEVSVLPWAQQLSQVLAPAAEQPAEPAGGDAATLAEAKVEAEARVAAPAVVELQVQPSLEPTQACEVTETVTSSPSLVAGAAVMLLAGAVAAIALLRRARPAGR